MLGLGNSGKISGILDALTAPVFWPLCNRAWDYMGHWLNSIWFLLCSYILICSFFAQKVNWGKGLKIMHSRDKPQINITSLQSTFKGGGGTQPLEGGLMLTWHPISCLKE